MHVLSILQHCLCRQIRRITHRAKKTVATTVAADGRHRRRRRRATLIPPRESISTNGSNLPNTQTWHRLAVWTVGALVAGIFSKTKV